MSDSIKYQFINTIRRGDFDLETILKRIDIYHIDGKLTDEERDEVIGEARAMAIQARDVDAKTEIIALWAKMRELENRIVLLESADGSGETPVESEVVAEYVQPTGVHDAYHTGDKVLYDGVIYESTMDNNVWSPAAYPSGWTEVTTTAATE